MSCICVSTGILRTFRNFPSKQNNYALREGGYSIKFLGTILANTGKSYSFSVLCFQNTDVCSKLVQLFLRISVCFHIKQCQQFKTTESLIKRVLH